jgi:hypothetical protein
MGGSRSGPDPYKRLRILNNAFSLVLLPAHGALGGVGPVPEGAVVTAPLPSLLLLSILEKEN